ncbi:hypothetical protein [Pseudacidovorax intermedius]|uniref:hypothetical protein n=1 Tax=Pseudacidovorax intermedius TaxID=433924 RepID=UPI0026EA8752|nr:hypothetical protein [Pseudacidovorax intermedius]
MYKYSASTGGFYLEAIHGDAVPSDAVDVSEAQHAALIDGQTKGLRIVPGLGGAPTLADQPMPTEEERIRALTVVVQGWLDTTARGDDFDHIGSAVSYADEPAVPSFQLLGRRYRKWRSVVWAACYQVLDEWRAGERAEPTAESLLAELPAFDTITVD